jgi:hypothetical protein
MLGSSVGTTSSAARADVISARRRMISSCCHWMRELAHEIYLLSREEGGDKNDNDTYLGFGFFEIGP